LTPPILITAALKVHAKHTELTSIETRKKLYADALLEWIIHTPLTSFVFCDNSNALTDDFTTPILKKAISLNKTVEFLQFEGSHKHIRKQGKGFGEGELIDYALTHSKLLQNSHGFYKITGKLFIDNFNTLHSKINDTQNYMRRDTAKIEGTVAVDSRFFYMQKEFYKKYIQELYKGVDDDNGIYIERLIYKQLLPMKVVKNFPILPNIIGFSGSTRQNYTQERFISAFRRKLFFLLGQYKI